MLLEPLSSFDTREKVEGRVEVRGVWDRHGDCFVWHKGGQKGNELDKRL